MPRAAAPPVRPGPPAGIVDAWRVPLRSPELPAATFRAVLSLDERARAARMKVGAEEWALARGALRHILAHYLGERPRQLRFERGAVGKPRLAGGRGPQFNLSSRGELALVAVACDREVGVDIEREDDIAEIQRLSSEFLSPLEAAAVESADPTQRKAAFFAAWTRHEARRKLHGIALEDEPATLPPDQLVVVRAVAVQAGYAAAIAAEGSTWTVRAREVTEAL